MPDEIQFDCSCPDWADMCKHVAAVLYAVGNRLDSQPELLFVLRKVDPRELITGEINLGVSDSEDTLDEDSLTDIFGVEIDTGSEMDESMDFHENLEPGKAVKPIAGKTDISKTDPQISSIFRKDENGLVIFTGPAIIELQEKLGLTRSAFARQIHVSPKTVSLWQKKKKPFKPNLRTQIELETLVKFGVE